MTPTPKDPGVDGAPNKGMHDGMPQEGHDKQFDHADKGGKSDRTEQEDED